MPPEGTTKQKKAENTIQPANIRTDDDIFSESLDPNDSARLRDQIKGQTTEHAMPPRLEDEGQSGG